MLLSHRVTSLTIRDMQVKTALRYHLSSAELGKLRSVSTTLCWSDCKETGSLTHS